MSKEYATPITGEIYQEFGRDLDQFGALFQTVDEYKELFAEDLKDQDPLTLFTELGLVDELKEGISELVNYYAQQLVQRLKNDIARLGSQAGQAGQKKEILEPLSFELLNFQNEVVRRLNTEERIKNIIGGMALSEIKTAVSMNYFYYLIKLWEEKAQKPVDQLEIHNELIDFTKSEPKLSLKETQEMEQLVPYYQVYFWKKFMERHQETISPEEQEYYREIGDSFFADIKEIARSNQVPFSSIDINFEGAPKRLIFAGYPADSLVNLDTVSKVTMLEDDFERAVQLPETVSALDDPNTQLIIYSFIVENGIDFGVSRTDGELTAGIRGDRSVRTLFKTLDKEALYDKLKAEILQELYRLLREKDIESIDLNKYQKQSDVLKELEEREAKAKPLATRETEDFVVTKLPAGVKASQLAIDLAKKAGIELEANQESIVFKNPNRVKPSELIEEVQSSRPKKEKPEKEVGRIAAYPYQKVEKALESHGCVFKREGKGSHRIWQNPHDGSCPVPRHQIGKGLLQKIAKQLSLDWKELGRSL